MANYTNELSSVSFSLERKYRSSIEIIALILSALKYCEIGRYSLMKHTSVNYSQLKKYLKILNKIGFIETSIKEGHVLYRTSESGLAYLRQYATLQEMLLGACSRSKLGEVIHERRSPMPFVANFIKTK